MSYSDTNTDVLLANLEWARRLARALVQDEARADDLLQDAWLRSRSKAPVDGGRDAADGRRWLGRVIRNLASDARRSGRRRAQREALAARPEAAPADEDLRGRLVQQEALGRWVLELDEPYRRTMLLRWFEGQAAAAIAAGEGVPLATVRTRLQRGAALLRARAEREAPGNGRAWLAALAGVPTTATPAAVASPVSSSVAPSVALTTGVFIMNIKVLAILAVAVLLGAAWTMMPRAASGPDVLEEPEIQSVESAGAAAPAVDGAPLEIQVGANEGRVVPVTVAGASEVAAPTDPAAAEEGDLLVRVIGADGKPAIGESVVVVHGRSGDEAEWLTATSEKPDGIARFEDYLGDLQRDQDYQGVPKFVGLDVIGFEPPRLALPSAGLPEVIPELRVPPHAELVVRLVGEDGAAFPMSESVFVTPLGAGADPNRSVERGDRASLRLREQAEARFPRVAPGTKLWLQVLPAGVLADVEQVVKPLKAGERRTVELVIGAKDAHVTGRVVHPDGSPVAISSFDVAFEPYGSARVYTIGADGSFALPLDRLGVKEGSFGVQIDAQLYDGSYPPQPERLTGAFQAVVPDAGEAYDVGAVVLRPAPTIAAGRVVDATGAPVEGASIALYEKINQREDPEDFNWGFAGVGYVRTDAEGRFDLKGKVEPGEYALRIKFVDWIDRGAHRFQAGDRGIELIVDRKRLIAGRLVLPNGVDPTRLEVRAKEEGASRERATYTSWTTSVDAHGSFTLRELRPEAVTVSVYHLDLSDPIAEKRGVLPRLDGEGPVPGLDPWDLSDDLTQMGFHVYLADGKPMTDGFVALGPHVLEHDSGRVATVIPSRWGDELQVFAPGHVPARARVAADLKRVDLVRGPRVVVSLAAPLPDPPEGVLVELSLVPKEPAWALPEGDDAHWSYRLASRLGSESVRCLPGETSWELHGAGPGRYRPRWNLIAPRRGPLDTARFSSFVSPTGRYEIELSAGGSATAYTAEYDREDWDEAVRRVTEER